HGAVPGRRRRRFHHRLDAVGERRPAYVLMVRPHPLRCTLTQSVRISRRSLLLVPVLLITASMPAAAQTEYENLEYRDGRLHWSRGGAAAAVGRAGVKADKHEGDGGTPAGNYPLVSVFYRPDRIAPPASKLP